MMRERKLIPGVDRWYHGRFEIQAETWSKQQWFELGLGNKTSLKIPDKDVGRLDTWLKVQVCTKSWHNIGDCIRLTRLEQIQVTWFRNADILLSLCVLWVLWRWAAMGHTEKSREIQQKFFSADIFGLPNWPCLTFSCRGVRKQMKQNNSLNCKSIFLYYFEVS